MQSFVTCPVGIWRVGLVTIPYGIANVLVSLLSGIMVLFTGRIPVVVLAFLIDLGIQVRENILDEKENILHNWCTVSWNYFRLCFLTDNFTEVATACFN